MLIIGNLFSLAAFICCILVGIKGIQAKDVALGVISILCWIVAIVMVFTKQTQWGISNNLKIALLVCIVGCFVFTGIGFATAPSVVVVH